MKLAALYRDDAPLPALHVALDDGFAAVDDIAAGDDMLTGLKDAGELYTLGSAAVRRLREIADRATATVSAADVRYAPPVLAPSKIICVGLNYSEHIAEAEVAAPEHIVLFAKFASCLIGNGDPIIIPPVSTQVDYEGEIAVIIGQRARNVPVQRASDYIGGFTIINDVTARDLQRAEPQWIRGKALDTFAPLGPVVLDAAEAPPVADMTIRTLVNGELRQDGSGAQMITGVPELIAYISMGVTLEPGDIIATGTPSGVGMSMNPPAFLAAGDKVTIEISGIGELVNAVAGFAG